MSRNPFRLNEIPVNEAFCNREASIAQLVSYAESDTHVVVYSPRRYGKTSLVKRVQHKLQRDGYICVYSDLFGVTSIEDIAARITRAIFSVTRLNDSVFKRAVSLISAFRPVLSVTERGDMSVSVQPAFKSAGLDTLAETMEGLERFLEETGQRVQIVLDEFQEIIEVDNSLAIESILRSHIQKMPCSFFFVGSRRRILLEMFNARKRPFFQSAVNFELEPLPMSELTQYIAQQFKKGAKSISTDQSREIAILLKQHPGYMQKFCFFLFEISGSSVTSDSILDARQWLFENEKNYFESILQGLSAKQSALLIAIAREPGSKLFSAEFMSRHNLKSTGGVQNSLLVLSNRDLVEKKPGMQGWSLVDPVFKSWILETM